MSTIKASGLGPLTASNTATIVDPATPVNGIATLSPLVAAPAVVTNTGATSYTLITGIPAWAKRVTVVATNLTMSASTNPAVQIGPSSGVATTGYTYQIGYAGSSQSAGSITNCFSLRFGGPGAGDTLNATLTLFNVTGNIWSATLYGSMYSAANYFNVGGGWISLSGQLDRIVLTSTGGATTYSAGYMNVFYE